MSVDLPSELTIMPGSYSCIARVAHPKSVEFLTSIDKTPVDSCTLLGAIHIILPAFPRSGRASVDAFNPINIASSRSFISDMPSLIVFR